MNIISEADVLKPLLFRSKISIYSLEKDLKELFAQQDVKVNYPTLWRRVNKLIAKGLIEKEMGERKNGKADNRNTKNLSLSLKGLVFLILKTDLTDKESRKIVQNILLKAEYKKFKTSKNISIQDISIKSIKESFKQLRPRVNLEYFDEEYFMELLFENLIIESTLNHFITWTKEDLEKLSERKLQLFRKKAIKDLKKFPAEDVNQLFLIFDYLRMKRESWNRKIVLLKPIVSLFHKKGYKKLLKET